MRSVIWSCRLRFGAGGCSHLYIFICKWHSRNERRSDLAKFYHRRVVETEKSDIYGIFPMIVGSLYVTAGAIIIGVPIGILTAVFMADYCPKAIYKPLKRTELLAGIPSVVYGFFGLVVLVPLVRKSDEVLTGRQRKQYDHCIHSAWNDDPANDHRSDRISTQSSSDTVL